MSNITKTVLDKLKDLDIHYSLISHPAAFTVEDLDRLDIPGRDEIPKNLFLRDDKKKRFFLVVLSKDKQVNLKELGKKLNSRPLGFASEELLNTCLRLSKGAVSPLGVLNDDSRKVEVLIDKSLLSYKQIGVHPNENTATVFLCLKDLERVIADHGNRFAYIDI